MPVGLSPVQRRSFVTAAPDGGRIVESALAAMFGELRGLQTAAGDFFAGALRNRDPGFRVTVHLGSTGARALAGTAVVLAGLDDAGALLRFDLVGSLHTGRGRDAGGEQTSDGGTDDAVGFAHDH